MTEKCAHFHNDGQIQKPGQRTFIPAQFVENAGRIIIRVENAGRNARILFSGPALFHNIAEFIWSLGQNDFYLNQSREGGRMGPHGGMLRNCNKFIKKRQKRGENYENFKIKITMKYNIGLLK